jgi:UDP-N-acetylglucosamine:LPS N-acetylglucosamine transferase
VAFSSTSVIHGYKKKSKTVEHNDHDSSKKTVLVISCKGGGGHTSASLAIKQYVGSSYNIRIVNLFDDILGYLDPVQFFTFKYRSAEHLYNKIIQKGSRKIPAMMVTSLKHIMPWLNPIFSRAFVSYLKHLDNTPDAIISVIPLFNGALKQGAQDMGIPFSVIAPDFDTHHYTFGLSQPIKPTFHFGVPYNDNLILSAIKDTLIKDRFAYITGFPVREEFLHHKHSKSELKKSCNIASSKPIIMVLMGSVGSKQTYAYAEYIKKHVTQPIHLILCLGHNTKDKKRLEKMVFPDHITTSILGFTDKIPDLMRMADILITKPGPTSISEALYSNVPVIVDNTEGVLSWEQLNINFVKKHRFGCELTNMSNLNHMLTYMMSEPVMKELKENISDYAFPDSQALIHKLIERMLE